MGAAFWVANLHPRIVNGSGNVASYGVDRLHFTAISSGFSGVNDGSFCQPLGLFDGVDRGQQFQARAGHKLTDDRVAGLAGGGQTSSSPGRPTAIQQHHSIVAQIAQQPPEPGRKPKLGIVVDRNPPIGINAPKAQLIHQAIDHRQRMPTAMGANGPRQIPLQIRIDRAGNVGSLVLLLSQVAIAQGKPTVHHHPIRIRQHWGQLFRRNQLLQQQFRGHG